MSFHFSTFPLPPLLVQHVLNVLLARALGPRAALGRKRGGDLHLVRALLPQLLESSLLLDVGDAPLLEVLDPGGGAVALKGVGLAGTGALGGGGVLVRVEDVVGVEAGEVGVAGGPAEGAFVAVGDGVAGADGVGAGGG